MSLRVWLPLNLDTRNLGLSQVNIDNSDLTLDVNSHKSSNLKNLMYSPDLNNNSVSFGGWFKFNKAEIKTIIDTKTYTSVSNLATGLLIGNSNYGGICLYWVSNTMYQSEFTTLYIGAGIRSAQAGHQYTILIPINFDEWTNLFLTFNRTTNILSLYKNGVLEQTKTITDVNDYIYENIMLNKAAIHGGNGWALSIPFLTYDIRIYDHCLSQKEIKEISKGLIFHSKFITNHDGESINREAINPIYKNNPNNFLDLSGFNNSIITNDSFYSGSFTNSNKYGKLILILQEARIYPYAIGNFSDNSKYVKLKDLIESGLKEFSFSFWINPMTSTTTGCIWNGRSTTGKAVGIFYINLGIRFDDDGSLTLSSTIALDKWTHIVCTYKAGGQKCIYINGVLDKSVSAGTIIKSNQYATIGTSMTDDATPSGNNFRGFLNDYRIYRTALSAEDVQELYSVNHIIDDALNEFSYQILEDYYNDEKSELYNQGNLHAESILETKVYSHFDSSIYTEPDGSKWIRIFHHNNPASASNLFSASDDFTKPLYKNENAWFDFLVCNLFDNIHLYEFIAKLKTTSDASELKWRWILFFNPMSATWEQVSKSTNNSILGNTTRIDTNEYSAWTTVYGGIYRYTTGIIPHENTYLRLSNANSANWWGALGVNQLYTFEGNTGIPGFNEYLVTSGYIDVYIRIDNLFRFKKILTFTNSQFVEDSISWTGTEYKDIYVYSGKTTMYNGQLCYIWDMYDGGILKSSDYYTTLDSLDCYWYPVKLLTNTLNVNLPLTKLSSEYVAILNLDDSDYGDMHRDATILQSTEIPNADVEIAENRITANEFIEI